MRFLPALDVVRQIFFWRLGSEAIPVSYDRRGGLRKIIQFVPVTLVLGIRRVVFKDMTVAVVATSRGRPVPFFEFSFVGSAQVERKRSVAVAVVQFGLTQEHRSVVVRPEVA